MTFFRGRMPLILFVATALFSVATQAQHTIPLTLAEAEDLALGDEPGYAALRARADALDEYAVAAGQLPDPTMRVGKGGVRSGGRVHRGRPVAVSHACT